MSLFIDQGSSLIECNKARVNDLLHALVKTDPKWNEPVNELLDSLTEDQQYKCGWGYHVPNLDMTDTLIYCIQTTLSDPNVLT